MISVIALAGAISSFGGLASASRFGVRGSLSFDQVLLSDGGGQEHLKLEAVDNIIYFF